MNRKFSVTVKGKEKTWGFMFEADSQYIDDWLEDGLDIEEIVNIIPCWAIDLGLLRPWCAVQDVWRWLRIW